MTSWLKHAFEVDPPGPAEPSAEERDLIDRLARAVVRRGLTSPALIFLECGRPLNFLASQFMVFFAPIVTTIFRGQEYPILAQFLDRRGSVEYICRRIEAADGAAPSSPANASNRRSPSDQSPDSESVKRT